MAIAAATATVDLGVCLCVCVCLYSANGQKMLYAYIVVCFLAFATRTMDNDRSSMVEPEQRI